MKKVYIISAIVLVALVSLLVYVITYHVENSYSGEEKIYTIKTNYTYNVADNEKLEVLCYSNNPKSFLKEYKGVRVSFDNNKEGLEQVLISGIIEDTKVVDVTRYNNEKLYLYKMYIELADINLEYPFDECILKTNQIEINIGTLSLVNYDDRTNQIDFSKIYAVGNNHLGFKSINGFVITLTNKGQTPYYVTDIKLGEYNYCSVAKTKVLEEEFLSSQDIKTVITDYNPTKFKVESGVITIPERGSVTILVPVYYQSKAFLNNTPIFINNELYIDGYNHMTSYEDIDQYESIIIEGKLDNIN